MIDSGAQMYMGGECYYRQLDQLAISFCSAEVITEERWSEYILGGYAMMQELGVIPKVSMAAFTKTGPSAVHRRMLANHIQEHDVPPLTRIAVLTDNALLRGAMTAFGWLMPITTLRAFSMADVAGCVQWLRQGGMFNEKSAIAAWNEARAILGTGARPTHRPSGGSVSGR